MNIKELKEKISKLPDDMLVCGKGYYGEMLEVYSLSGVDSVIKYNHINMSFSGNAPFPAFVISMERPGEEHD